MPIPVHYLIGSPRRLLGAVVLFVALDLTVLVTNLWIAAQVAEDAVAINLAGRQRMLSQRITKSLLLAQYAPDVATQKLSLAELSLSASLFADTLMAFSDGGAIPGGDGKIVMLRRIDDAQSRRPVTTTLKLWAPLSERLRLSTATATGTLSSDDIAWSVAYMTRNNRDILEQMNQLTTTLQQHSVARVQRLRVVQTVAFLLALANFLVIVLGLVKQYKHVEQDGQKWREKAQRDGLTGLYNRAAFYAAVDQQLADAALNRTAFSVLILDLDGFKPINDALGHAVGDMTLQKVASALHSVARETDTVARLGGDEFALLCPNLHSPEHVGHLCDRIVSAVANIAIKEGEPANVRASLGTAIFPAHGTNRDELLAAADKAMYTSKRLGGGNWNLAVLNR